MLKRMISASAVLVAACATATPIASVAPGIQLGEGPSVEDSLRAINAVCGADSGAASENLKRISGMGTGGFKVDTASPEAQAWFDYGLALSHAFYHEDAKTAMKRSAEADPACSRCAWGEAWVFGPTLNYGFNDADKVIALEAAQRARKLAKPGDQLAAQLAAVAEARYGKTTKTTARDFGAAMKAIADANPDNAELSVLAVHAMLIPVRGDDKTHLKPALAMLDQVLAKHPDDTGAIHYYIHATEFDDRAEDALAYADKLGRLAPSASHLVHMPSHTFFHAGRYEDAAVVNAEAIGTDAMWWREGAKRKGAVPMYFGHNLAFGVAGALMAGDAQLALKLSDHIDSIWTATGSNALPAGKEVDTRLAYALPRTWVVLARHAPDRMLALPAPTQKDQKFAIYHHYARGEALVLKGDIAGARGELAALSRTKKNERTANERAIATDVLAGRILMAEGRFDAAGKRFAKAAKRQEKHLADSWDPPQWWYPVRRSLAAAHLQAGDYAAAETEAKASLASWKHDPLALWVLAKAEAAQGKTSDAATHQGEARKGWRGRFETITAGQI